MQSISTELKDSLEQGLSLKIQPMLLAEFNHNRYASTLDAGNWGQPVDAFPDTFPIGSIVLPNRPSKGIVKSRVGEARTSGSSISYRTVSKNSPYKYWCSPAPSTTGGAISNVAPYILYGSLVNTNKIVVTFETSISTPANFTIEITVDGTNWILISTNPVVDSDGRVTLYRQSEGSWNSTADYDNPLDIMGVRVVVTTINLANKYFNLIEISARLQVDLSSDLINCGVEKMLEEASLVLPIGNSNTNTFSASLDNSDGKFNSQNESGPYFGLLDDNVSMELFYGINTEGFGGSGIEYVRQGIFYSSGWGDNSSSATVTVDGTDFSKYLQEVKISGVLFQNKTAPEIVEQILYMAGFNSFVVKSGASTNDHRIPYVFFDDEVTVWEAITQIARGEQDLIVFDEDGYLNYIRRDWVFDKLSGAAELNLSAIKEGLVEPNLIDVDFDYQLEANRIILRYRPQSVNMNKRDNKPIDSVLWKPENTVALQTAHLVQPMTTTSTTVKIQANKARTFPYSGYLNIEGEIVKYSGKQYRYYLPSGASANIVLYSTAEKEKIDLASHAIYGNNNAFTGVLANVLRGQKQSKAAAHNIDLAGWTLSYGGPGISSTVSSWRMKRLESSMQLWGPGTTNYGAFLIARRGTGTDSYKVYGTEIEFDNLNYLHGAGGLVLHLQSDLKSGYYFEVALSKNASAVNIKEIRAFRRYGNDTIKYLPVQSEGTGQSFRLLKGQKVRVEVTYTAANKFIMYVNGRLALSFTDPYASPLIQGRSGVYVRGHTTASFEYFFNHKRVDDYDVEESSLQDLINGGYTSGYAYKEIHKSGKNSIEWIFDDFGPHAHEVREFDIKFDKYPALDSKIFMSNVWDADIIEHNQTPFRSKFTIVSSGRDTAILNGDDPTIVPGQQIKQQLFLYGELVVEEEEKALIIENIDAIRKHGAVEIEFNSPWLQTEEQAREIGDFITAHWSEPVDVITVENFARPDIQVGDFVTVNYPDKDMSPTTHKYHVISVSTEFDQGINSTLTLRRAR